MFCPSTNVPEDEKSALEILRLYKMQDGIEKNFGFLKDPSSSAMSFLKKPHRIEALVLILVIALLIWRLMERNMRMKIKANKITLPGWNSIRTSKLTSFMMASNFLPSWAHSITVVALSFRHSIRFSLPI